MDFSKMAGLSSILDFAKRQFTPQETEVVQEEVAVTPDSVVEETTVEDYNPYIDHLIEKEGIRYEAYKPTTKENEPWTIGVGATGEGIAEGTVWTPDEVRTRLQADIVERLPEIRRQIPNFDSLPIELKVPLLGSWFRGGVSGSPKTKELIAEGNFTEAAKEFLRNKEYEESKTQAGIDKGMRGIGTRMEEFSEALREHGENVKGKATGGMVMRNPYNNYNKQRAI